MKIEREQNTKTFDTPRGKLTVTSVWLIHREPRSGQNQIFNMQRESVNFQSEGDWLSDEMASELAGFLLEGGTPPKWLDEA